jgi:PKD repeat protein
VLFAFADGCVGECESGGPNSYSSKATVARQSGGKGLLAAFDVAEPAVPQRACLSGRRDDQASYLRWVKPDAGGSEITSYQIFRGTSPGNEVLIGQQVGGKNTYTDRSADPAVAKYTYKIVAVNAVGEGQPSNSVELEIAPRLEATGSCSLPGVTVLTDPIGDASDQQQAHDITSVSLAEPDALAGKLVFTIKVVSLSGPVPPNFRYAVRFSAPAPPPDAPGVGAQEDWFVSYVSGAEQFTYGTTGVPQNAARVFTTVGNLDPESHVDPDGTITLVIDKNIIGATAPGDGITNIFGSVRLNGPTGGTNETIPDSTGTSSYQLRPANLCLPNTAPVARLTSDVESGPDPLTVHFDATGSYDVDLIDTIASYTFNFGDGSDDVVQTSDSPTITHTFSQPGEYIVRLVVTDSRGKVSANTDQRKIEVGAEEGSPTPTATPTPTASPGGGDVQLLNISGRLYAQGGDKVGIGGFIVRGTGTKRVILRAMGPSLKVGNQPVPGTLQDPVVELHDNEGGVLVKDNWRDTQEAEIQQTGLAPSDDREAAIVKRLTPGNYTALIRGANDTTGIGLVEIYDLDSSEPIEFGNLSVRSEVGTGDNVLIDGMIIGGTPRRVLFRAIGPSLQNQGVSGALEDPTLELHGGNGELLTSNDNWHDASNAGEIQDTGLAPGDDRESAILETLQPGVYTSIVRGKDNSTGIALAEVYNVP